MFLVEELIIGLATLINAYFLYLLTFNGDFEKERKKEKGLVMFFETALLLQIATYLGSVVFESTTYMSVSILIVVLETMFAGKAYSS